MMMTMMMMVMVEMARSKAMHVVRVPKQCVLHTFHKEAPSWGIVTVWLWVKLRAFRVQDPSPPGWS